MFRLMRVPVACAQICTSINPAINTYMHASFTRTQTAPRDMHECTHARTCREIYRVPIARNLRSARFARVHNDRRTASPQQHHQRRSVQGARSGRCSDPQRTECGPLDADHPGSTTRISHTHSFSATRVGPTVIWSTHARARTSLTMLKW